MMSASAAPPTTRRGEPTAGDIALAVRGFSLVVERWRAAFARRHGLADNDPVILSMLMQAPGGLRPRDISVAMGVTTGTLTAMIDRLEARDFVQRRANPDDRRSTLVFLTDRGSGVLGEPTRFFEDSVETRTDRAQWAMFVSMLHETSAVIQDVIEQYAG